MKEFGKASPIIFSIFAILVFVLSIVPEVFQKEKTTPQIKRMDTRIYTVTFSKEMNTISIMPSNGYERCIQTATLSELNDGMEYAVFECND